MEPPAKVGKAQIVTIVFLTLLGAAMRLYNLSSWSLAGEEFFTLRDSMDPQRIWTTVKPLQFFLNHYLVRPFIPLDELGLRILPAVFGIVSIPAVYVAGSRLVGPKAAIIAAAFLTVNPWHIYFSQLGRFYSLVFLLSLIFVVALYEGFNRRDALWLTAGAITCALAVLAHPSSALVLAGLCCWIVLSLFGARVREGIRDDRMTLWIGGALVGASAATAYFYLWPMLESWIALNQSWGYSGLGLLPAYAIRVTFGVCILALAAVPLLWMFERQRLAGLMVCVAGVPLGALTVLAFIGVSVDTAYLFATLPFLVLGAGVFVEHVAVDAPHTGWIRAWIVGGACLLTAVATGVPALVSHYIDGSRPDIRGAAQELRSKARPGDIVLADLPAVLTYYSPESAVEVEPFHRTQRQVERRESEIRSSPNGRGLWILAYLPSQGGFGVRDLGSAEAWITSRCELELDLSPIRIDSVKNYVRLYRCTIPID